MEKDKYIWRRNKESIWRRKYLVCGREEGRRRKKKKIFSSQRRRRTVKEKEEKDGRKSKGKTLKKKIKWTCLLVRNEPASTLLLSWRPHPSPCLPGSRFPKIDHSSLFSFHNMYLFSHLLSLPLLLFCLSVSFLSVSFLPYIFLLSLFTSPLILLSAECAVQIGNNFDTMLTSPQAKMTRTMETSIMSSSKNLLTNPWPCWAVPTAAVTGLSAISKQVDVNLKHCWHLSF